MAKYSELKRRFEELMARLPDPSAASQEEQKKLFSEVFSLFIATSEPGSKELHSKISAYLYKLAHDADKLSKLLHDNQSPSKLLHDKFSTRVQESHKSDGAMLASTSRKW